MRMRRKTYLDERVEKCRHLLVSGPETFRGRWLGEFGTNEFNFDELHVELGCGKGLFTVETAKNEPKVLLVALEKITNVLVLALERAEQEGVQNVRFVNRLADYIADYFDRGEVSRIYINFCDPWPANRHSKRRLTGYRFLEMYKHVLKPGGEIHFKTDNLPLFEFSLNEFTDCGYILSEITRNLHEHGPAGIMTDYESKFYAEGKPICRLVASYDQSISEENES